MKIDFETHLRARHNLLEQHAKEQLKLTLAQEKLDKDLIEIRTSCAIASQQIVEENKPEIVSKIREVLKVLFGGYASGLDFSMGDFESGGIIDEKDTDILLVKANINVAGIQFGLFKFELIPELKFVEIRTSKSPTRNFWSVDVGASINV